MPQPLNIILFSFGQPGINSIRALQAAGHRITHCFTHPTIHSWHPSIEDECRSHAIACSTEPDIGANDPADADAVLSIFYRRKISSKLLAKGTRGAFNVAASQLPRYRGYFPWRWAILNNESTWGVTVHQMTQNYCDGDVLHRRQLLIKPSENAWDLSQRVGETATTAAVEAMNKLATGDDSLTPAAQSAGKFFGPEVPHAGQIDWRQSAAKIDAFIRALDFGQPIQGACHHFTPPAQATINGQSIGIYRAHFGGTMSSYPPGTITRCDEQVWVQTGRGHLVIENVFAANQNHFAPDFFTSRGFAPGDMFDRSHSWSGVQEQRELSHAA